ncbi:MAG: TonB-dependent receptor [Thalassolituus oleivorans]|uniref:TonB-dependent receptor plug domain-containing protein n=1 Tax=Thalassolituus oleivorans TaxID=187493 RepID=UPI001B73CD22|nr:TonB-dependent receptor [Thalassolituus oleivorans]MBQ0727901.1 TonB-dependent receptor [Thalassolituus oleivorans]MBQ0781094.1 TonB-dependent receptor [Thalassolituus oleivorans]
MISQKTLMVFAPLLILISVMAEATENDTASLDSYLDMNIEELLSMEVTSVSKKKQRLSESAAAIFVITHDDIRRSGVTSIPEALRLAPGIQVAKIDNAKWAISSRGFNTQFVNKLLVLIDGRSVYTQSYSGVYWEDQDTLLEDVDRIEVIRGPGATLWGANAVNGVINIITKAASETQGSLVQVSGGNEERVIAQLRHGIRINDDVTARTYLKYADRDSSYAPDIDASANDDWQARRAGFRVDGGIKNDTWTVQGDVYSNLLSQTLDNIYLDPSNPANNPPDPVTPYRLFNTKDSINASGHNVLGRVNHQINSNSHASLQVYFDHTKRSEYILEQEKDTFDFDFQHRYSGFNRHDIVWGLGYRRIDDHYINSDIVTFNDSTEKTSSLISAFIQDEIALSEENLRLTIGSKFERTDFTGVEIQPSVKLLWIPAPGTTLWGSVSRAARTPSAMEQRGSISTGLLLLPGVDPISFSNDADGNFESEYLTAYELGFRIQPTETTSLDISAFYNDYSNAASYEYNTYQIVPNPYDPAADPLVIPSQTVFDNKMDVASKGVELVADWRVVSGWRLQSTYSYLTVDTQRDADSTDVFSRVPLEGGSPEHQATLRSIHDIKESMTFDLWMQYVSSLDSTTLSATRDDSIGEYTSVNARFAWLPKKNIELSLVGRNLFDNRHPEFVGEYYILRSEVERSLYAQVKVEF